ncbi:hypothetical protein A2U01_0098270, partial [Trifolium medium]|nr:hypothetical protein [Trifolium medium]
KDGAKGAKRKRKGELSRPSKVLKKDGGSASQIVDLEAGGSLPEPKGGRTLRGRPINLITAGGEGVSENLSSVVKDA